MKVKFSEAIDAEKSSLNEINLEINNAREISIKLLHELMAVDEAFDIAYTKKEHLRQAWTSLQSLMDLY